MERRRRILLTNDDGFSAPGIHHFHEALRQEFAVTVVAPEKEQSGIGHAFTYNKPLTFRTHPFFGDKGYIVSGTPADCVKFALGHILAEMPDIVVSGINNGNNTGIAGYYSGTVAAAREGVFWQITGIAFSIGESTDDYLKCYAPIAMVLLQRILAEKSRLDGRKSVYYNVNFPSCHPTECRGIKITRQSLSFWDDHYTLARNGDGTVEYWLSGKRKDIEKHDDYDTRAIENRFIAVTPLTIDATASEAICIPRNFDNIL